MNAEKKPSIEDVILLDFKKRSEHLRNQRATNAMQRELLSIATEYHEKLKELGYPPSMSKAMLERAFDHRPAKSHGILPSTSKITIFS